MPDTAIEERVARLEGRVEGFEDRFASVERRLDALDAKVDRFRDELAGRITGLEQSLGKRIGDLDQRLSAQLQALDRKGWQHFIWTIGVQVAVLLAVVAALTGH